MPSELDVQMLARIAVLERSVTWLARIALAHSSEEEKEVMRARAIETTRPDTYEGLDPALVCLLAAETASAVKELWQDIVGPPKAQATG